MTSVPGLRDLAERHLATVLDGARTVALVNFPNHGNAGDPAIWLGTRTLLRRLGVRVGYASAWWDFDAASLRRAVGSAPVLINGGGNFGDLYQGQQSTRVQVLRTLPENPVVQLPQSIHFADPANEAAMAGIIAAHGGVRLMVRDAASVTIARERLGIEPVLSPDHAFGLGPQRREGAARVPVLWLGRPAGDAEHVDHGEPTGPDVERVEWMAGVTEEQAGWDARGRLAVRVNGWGQATWAPGTRGSGLRHAVTARTYAPLARRWVRRGLDIVSRGEVVVTDRLHGHVFCALLGIPHVALDNSYGKVSGALDTWTAGLPGVHRAEDGAQALALARELVERGRS